MTEKPARIPVDSFCLAAVVSEMQAYVGGRVQGIRQPTETEVSLGLYAFGKEAMVLLSCHPVFARAHLATRRPSNQPQPPGFCQALRSRIEGAQVVSVRQVGFDRILEMEFVGAKGRHLLIAELMGKHSNLILVGEDDRIVSSAKSVGRSKSSRPILSGMAYARPPFPPRPSLLEASEGEDLRAFEGASPFLLRLIEAGGTSLDEVRRRVGEGSFQPVLAQGFGAYPESVSALGYSELSRTSISIALEQHFDAAVRQNEIETLRQSLLGQLRRVLLAREVSLTDLRHAVESGHKASQWQRSGELILAYGHSIQPGQGELAAWDYDGTEARIKLDPELDWKSNANRYFERARKAKSRLGTVQDQIARIDADRRALESLIVRIESEARLDVLEELREEARAKRWLSIQRPAAKEKEDRPYEGHRVRELLGPQGFTILYGENSESNDFLTLRVAKPNDYWLHVRGHVSAHVVIATRNKPESVSRETLEFAARIAVQNSAVKHSGYVPVDYTLKKHVRKPRGAPRGTALYTHEKTIHIES
ncbi:MAG TPA: NFACT family protein [Fimbriimonas sp.]